MGNKIVVFDIDSTLSSEKSMHSSVARPLFFPQETISTLQALITQSDKVFLSSSMTSIPEIIDALKGAGAKDKLIDSLVLAGKDELRAFLLSIPTFEFASGADLKIEHARRYALDNELKYDGIVIVENDFIVTSAEGVVHILVPNTSDRDDTPLGSHYITLSKESFEFLKQSVKPMIKSIATAGILSFKPDELAAFYENISNMAAESLKKTMALNLLSAEIQQYIEGYSGTGVVSTAPSSSSKSSFKSLFSHENKDLYIATTIKNAINDKAVDAAFFNNLPGAKDRVLRKIIADYKKGIASTTMDAVPAPKQGR